MLWASTGIGKWPIVELIDCGGNLTWHYRYENQLGTLVGMADENGNRVAEFDTSKYGEVYHKHILFDGRASRIGFVTSAPGSDITRIELVPGVFFTEAVIGAVLRASDSETAATALVKSMDPFGVYIEIDDPADAVLDILNGGGQFVIFDNHFGSSSGGANTGGTWTSSYLTALPGAETTHLVCAGETFDGYMRGWQVQVNAAVPVYFDIAFATGDEIWVSGNVLGLVTANETEFCIIHPVGVNPENGATQTDPCQPESRYLWGGGYYLPPIVGFEMWHDGVFGIHGAQPGQNKSGQHYMWNRIYDINMGRWTTPDPAMSTWWNSADYVYGGPIQRTDGTGLVSYSFDEVNCTVTMNVKLQFDFNDDLKWSHDQMRSFANDVEREIEEQWSDKFVIKGPAFYWDWEWAKRGGFFSCPFRLWYQVPCKCPNGWTAKVDITYSIYQIHGWDLSDDLLVNVADSIKQSHTESDMHLGKWAGGKRTYSDPKNPKKAWGRQSDAAHEFGHFLGFDHPSAGKVGQSPHVAEVDGKGVIVPGSYNDPATGEPSSDIMGVGSGMNTAYAKPWVDALTGEYDDCGPFTASLR